jgi:hemoglobin
MSITEQPNAVTGPATLFDRIGGRTGLEKVVPDVVRLHLENPVCGERFRAAKKPPEELTRLAIEFFATGLSGLATYDGLSMPEAHAGMRVTDAEYVAVLDDILAALQQHGIGEQEQAELLYIAYGMKSEIIGK